LDEETAGATAAALPSKVLSSSYGEDVFCILKTMHDRMELRRCYNVCFGEEIIGRKITSPKTLPDYSGITGK
jgi:hypothetical protein